MKLDVRTWQEIDAEYQLFKTAFHSSMFVERTERGDAMFMKMLIGAVDLIRDHDAQDWLN